MSHGADVLFGSTSTSLVRWVKAKKALPDERVDTFVTRASLTSARHLVSALDGVVHLYVTTATSVAPQQKELLNEILHVELGSICASGWLGTTRSFREDFPIALAARTREWLSSLQATGRISGTVTIRHLEPGRVAKPVDLSPQAVSYVSIAGLTRWIEEDRERTYRQKLNGIQSLLGLRPSELARAVGVSREAVRQWFDGAPISEERYGDIDRLSGVVDALSRYFRPEVLPSLIRRRPAILGGKQPLDLIVARRENEVVEAYRQLFRAGVTQ